MEKPWLQHYDSGVPVEVDYPSGPLHHFLEESARRHPTLPATLFFDTGLTYSELDVLANQVAHALLNQGLQPGDPVALLLPNVPQFVICFYGILKAGGTVLPLDPSAAASTWKQQLNQVQATTLILLSKYYPQAQAILSETAVQQVVVTQIKEYMPAALRVLFSLLREKKDGHRPQVEPDHVWFQEWLAGQSASKPAVDVQSHDRALFHIPSHELVSLTPCGFSHQDLVTKTIQLHVWTTGRKGGEEIYLLAAPLSHPFSVIAGLNPAIYQAGCLILLPRWTGDSVLKALQQYKPTLLIGEPSIFSALLQHPQAHPDVFRSLRVAISGIQPLSLEIKQSFEAHTGCKLCEGLGLAMFPDMTHCHPVQGPAKPGSIGLPLPSTECVIIDPETGKPAPPYTIGTLYLRKAQPASSLAQNDAGPEDGWKSTHQAAYMDEDGYFYMVTEETNDEPSTSI